MFAPTEYLEHKFVDGGILDNIPADEVKKLGADKIISVKFANVGNEDPKSLVEVLTKSIDLLFEARAYEAKNISDYLLDLELPEATVFSIKKIDYCYEIGYKTTIENINEIKRILNKNEKI